MFRDVEQRRRVFGRLVAQRILPPACFGPDGPAPGTRERLRAEAGALEPTLRRQLEIGLALWDGSGPLSLSQLLALDSESRACVGSLLMAVGLGHGAIDGWLNETPAAASELA